MSFMERDLRILIVGQTSDWTLEASYQRAFAELECQVELFDLSQIVNGYVRLGRLGRLFNAFIPVEPWVRKANRDLLHQVWEWQPQVLINVAQHPVRVGTLAQIKAATTTRLIHLWPDTLVNWNTDLSACLPLYDLVAAHSKTTLPLLRQMGAGQVEWVPLAGDPVLHPHFDPTQIPAEYQADVSFVGGWRPEREALLSALGDFNLKVWGPDWGRRCKNNPIIMRAWQKRAVRGVEFSKVVAGSRVNLNIIDFSNYPSANMRFFEISAAGGLQISSTCPEMQDEFGHGEFLFYYQQINELPGLIQNVLENDDLRQRVSTLAHAKVLAAHTYRHRASSMLDCLQSRYR